jgi:cyclophilin family peptidyl-prolyl cis-trans isomerase
VSCSTPAARSTSGSITTSHTGDAQIFVNLADNRTLDFDYTVIGEVDVRGMAIVDTIQEGTRIIRIRMLPPLR